MANTVNLTKVVEPALLRAFWLSRAALEIPSSAGVRRHLHGMKLDGLGIHPESGTLFACEATTSGFLGSAKGDSHDGAATKLNETYARFSLLMHHQATREGLLTAAGREYGCELIQVRCHFVVPKGTRFIKALGYRSRFLELGVMELTEVELPPFEQKVMEDVLRESSGEIKRLGMKLR